MASWQDLTDTLNTGVLGAFGIEVIYTPQTGDPVTVRAIFESTREAEENAPGVYAVLFVRAGDLPQTPERGDEVTVDGVTYKVYDIETDTTGAGVLRMRQV